MKLKTYLKNVGNRFITLVFILLCISLLFVIGAILFIISIPLWPLTYILFGWSAPVLVYYVEWMFNWIEKTNFYKDWIK